MGEQWMDDYCAEYERTNGIRCRIVPKGRGRYVIEHVAEGTRSHFTHTKKQLVCMAGCLRLRPDVSYDITEAGLRAVMENGAKLGGQVKAGDE